MWRRWRWLCICVSLGEFDIFRLAPIHCCWFLFRFFFCFLTGVQMSSKLLVSTMRKKNIASETAAHSISFGPCVIASKTMLRRADMDNWWKRRHVLHSVCLYVKIYTHTLATKIIWCDNMRTHPSKLYRRIAAAAAAATAL